MLFGFMVFGPWCVGFSTKLGPGKPWENHYLVVVVNQVHPSCQLVGLVGLQTGHVIRCRITKAIHPPT